MKCGPGTVAWEESNFRLRGKSEHRTATHRVSNSGVRGENSVRRKVSQKTNHPPTPQGRRRERVKRRGKSPPPEPQGTGQEKPCVVQDKQGKRAAGPVSFRKKGYDSGYSLHLAHARLGTARCRERNDCRSSGKSARRGQNSAYEGPPALFRRSGKPERRNLFRQSLPEFMAQFT